jgi:hypothetical protein
MHQILSGPLKKGSKNVPYVSVLITSPLQKYILKKAVSLPEVYNKTAEINGFTVLQLLFEDIRLCQIMHGRRNMAG